MFFEPIPAKVLLPSPRPEWISTADRLAMWAAACVFAAAAGYLGWELLWHGAFLGLLGYVVGLVGGAVAAAADLVWRFLTGRHVQKDEQFRVSDQTAPSPPGDELVNGVDKLFKRYFDRYEPDQAERERWKATVAGLRKFHQDEIIEICRRSGVSANEVRWLIRYEVRQLKQRWQDKTLYEYRRQFVPWPGIAEARWIGLAVLVLGGGWAVVTLRAHLLADLVDVVALASAFWAWRCWLRVNLERGRYTADSEEHAQRQAEIDKEFRRWRKKLEARPKDADMAAWLGCDRTVLLGGALDHFQLPRSRLTAHAFLEQPGVAARRARIEGGPWRYAGYRFLVFLLAEDGVRQVRANLDFMKGTLTIRERTSYRYDAIVSMRFLQETRRRTFELRLTSGDPITVRLRDADPGEAQQDQDARSAEETQEAREAEEDTASDVTSLADLLHMLERAAGEGRNWLQERERAASWSGQQAQHHVGVQPRPLRRGQQRFRLIQGEALGRTPAASLRRLHQGRYVTAD